MNAIPTAASARVKAGRRRAALLKELESRRKEEELQNARDSERILRRETKALNAKIVEAISWAIAKGNTMVQITHMCAGNVDTVHRVKDRVAKRLRKVGYNEVEAELKYYAMQAPSGETLTRYDIQMSISWSGKRKKKRLGPTAVPAAYRYQGPERVRYWRDAP